MMMAIVDFTRIGRPGEYAVFWADDEGNILWNKDDVPKEFSLSKYPVMFNDQEEARDFVRDHIGDFTSTFRNDLNS